MPSLTSNQVETIYRDESYEAFQTGLAQQSDELEKQGFFSLFPTKEVSTYSTFKTHVFASYNEESARNPGEPLSLGTMGQGYAYPTAIRAEFSESRTIPTEYLDTVLKLGDYANEQGEIQGRNYAQAYASYLTHLFSHGGIAAATLAAVGNGSAGQHPRARIFNHALKGEQGAVIAEIPNVDYADPDTKPWFAFKGNEHIRAGANADTSASYAGKTLGFFNAGSSGAAATNMILSEANLEAAILHMENDVPWGPDRKFYAAPRMNTLVCSGNLRSTAAQIIELNEFRQNTPNNDKNVMFKSNKVFAIDTIIVNRFLPDNCWYIGAKGQGCRITRYKGMPLLGATEGPVKGTYVHIWQDMKTKIWVRDFLAYWSHWFDSALDIAWFAGSTPTALDSNNHPAGPTTASLVNWAD